MLLGAMVLGACTFAWGQGAGQTVRTSLGDLNLPGLSETVSLDAVQSWDVVQLITFLAHKGGLRNVVVDKDVAGEMKMLKLENVTVCDALEVMLSMNELAYEIKGGIMSIMMDSEYELKHGKSFYDKSENVIVELTYAETANVLPMLEQVKSKSGRVVADATTGTMVLTDTPEAIQAMKDVIARADLPTVSRVVPTTTKTFPLQYATVEEVEPQLKQLITEKVGMLYTDIRTKTIVVTDVPYVIDRVTDVIALLDRRPKQVFIESKIVQVSLGDEYKLGIDWNHLMQGVDERFLLGTTVAPPLKGGAASALIPTGGGVGSLKYQTVLGGGDLTVVLDALEEIGETRIHQNPHIAALDGEEATVKVITDRPYAEAQLESGTTNVVGEKISFIEVGVSLLVTPRINDEGMISMAIRPEISSVVDNYDAFRTVPVVRKSYAETTVMIADSETVIIAGMIENTTQDNVTSVPLLSRLPLVGHLFKSTSKSAVSEETVVFLTPRIITGAEPVILLNDEKKTLKPMRTTALGTSKRLKPARDVD